MNKIFNGRIAAVLVLGFSSGLPLALSGGTLQAWLTVEGVDIRTIGLFSLVGLPYTLKFLWAPLMDRFVIPIFGRRRGWIVLCQMVLIGIILGMSVSSPKNALWLLAILAFFLTFVSASQDIAIDAYRAEVLKNRERGLGAAVSVTGYRVAMLVSGALALVLSEFLGWGATYMLMALILTLGVLAVWLGPEPEYSAAPPASMKEAVAGPFAEFFSRSGVWSLLALIILYKLGDAFAGSLTTTFLIRGVNFSVGEVGAINKGMGLAATIIGAIYGGLLMARLRLFNSLLIFGILQAVSNLSFMVLALVGKNYPLMIFTIAFENLAGGMGTAAFVAFLMALCNQRYTATQFALLSALASLGRVFVGPLSGVLVDEMGWAVFFFSTFLFALPGLILLWVMKHVVMEIENETVANPIVTSDKA
jgi:PAT family beta-lactamase induction signal transducer AmpG|tara:strand:- start:209 stop:1465 length:1257 start_codon:yes stop_codon:yes gene_type:complete